MLITNFGFTFGELNLDLMTRIVWKAFLLFVSIKIIPDFENNPIFIKKVGYIEETTSNLFCKLLTLFLCL